MKKLDIAGVVLNGLLSVFYLPFSSFCFFLQMVSEARIDATNPLYILINKVFCGVCAGMPLVCIVSIVLSVVLRDRGKSGWSFAVQFAPLVIFGLNLCLALLTDFVPKVL